MDCIIKDRQTFANKCLCTVYDYRLTPDSIYDEISTISIKYCEGINEGDFIIYGDYIGIINSINPDKLKTILQCEHIVKLFARDIPYLADPEGNTEDFLKAQIESNYQNASDIVYRIPFLRVIAYSSSGAAIKPDVESSIWNIKSYISKVRRMQDVFTAFAAKRTVLEIHIAKKEASPKKIDMSSPLVKVLEETFSDNRVGKITTITEQQGVTDWYLLTDGTVTNQYRETGRVYGEWLIINVREDDEAEAAARELFLKNAYSHKLLISVPREHARYGFYDKLLIARKGRVYRSYIAAIRKTKNSTRVEYQCGELRTTLTDKTRGDL